jgi:hypothetical protein
LDDGKFYAIPPLVFRPLLRVMLWRRRSCPPRQRAGGVRHGDGRRYGMCDKEFDIVLAGSLFKGVGPLLIDTITQEIHLMAPKACIVRARFEPAVGSVLLAYDALGIEVSDEMYSRLAETLPAAELFDTSRGDRPARPGARIARRKHKLVIVGGGSSSP